MSATVRTRFTGSKTALTVPNMRTLYPAAATCSEEGFCEDFECAACEEAGARPLTPRNALLLYFTAQVMFDTWSASIKDGTLASEVIDYLPPVCQNSSAEFLTRFTQCFADYAKNLAEGKGVEPSCTGEELALHLMLDQLESELAEYEDVSDWIGLDDCDELFPAHFLDGDISMLRDCLFEDHDVLMLYDMALDGLEDSEVTQTLGAVNLHPSKWFLPFNA